MSNLTEIRMLCRQLLLNLHLSELLTSLSSRKYIRMVINSLTNRRLWILEKIYFRFFLLNRLRFTSKVLLNEFIR